MIPRANRGAAASLTIPQTSTHVFVANRAMNCVEVFSSADASRAAQISIAGASSADLSADGATVWIGTVTEQVAAIDTASLQVKALYATSGLLPVPPVPNTVFDRPEELLALSNGKLMMRLRQAQTAEALLALWDPVSNTPTNLTPIEPQLFQHGLGAMARTGDRTKVLVAANDTSGELAEFNSNGNVVEGPHGLGIGRIPLVASPRTPHSQLNRTNPSFNFLILSASKILSVLTNQRFSSSQKT